MKRPKPTGETLPLGGDYLLTPLEIDALSLYTAEHITEDPETPLRVWRGTSGTLYLCLEKGGLLALGDSAATREP